METNNKLFKMGKTLFVITSGLLLSNACFASSPADTLTKTRTRSARTRVYPTRTCERWTPEKDQILRNGIKDGLSMAAIAR
jgi:hypothetical protein